ncbi:MAG: tungstate transport system substrate-binding protein [Saprospiraceae bacterium]|jgi:tungstate transport system substrate-binding protein
MRFVVFLLAFVTTVTSISAYAQDKTLRLATTTSTDNSGLLDHILPAFEASTGYKVHVVAVGTGKALRMGKDGDADLLLVHAPQAEQDFVGAGYGLNRTAVMYNDFVVVGPKADPAKITTLSSIPEVMKALVDSNSIFVSRADDSGTHKKELSFWQEADIIPSGINYREAGQGMGKVLRIAGELDAYTLVDRGTWLAYKGESPLKLVFEGNPSLFNPYSFIRINPMRFADLNHEAANALIEWMTAELAQNMIGSFQINGESLFYPDA